MGRPKALLRYRDVTFLEHILKTIDGSSLDYTLVVLGKDRRAIQNQVKLPRWVYNEKYEQGMTSSFQAGIRALPTGVTAAMLFLVDHPMVTVPTIQELLASESDRSIVVPVYQGNRGHPVLFSKEVLEEVLELPASVGANAVVRSDPTRVVEVQVDDEGILLDIDTPSEFDRWVGN